VSLLRALIDAGLTLRTDGQRLVVAPASALTAAQRDLIRARKSELLVSVRHAEVLAATLVASINQCCDVRGDDERNRAALIAECMQLTQRDQADMLEHFETEAAELAGLRQPQKKESS